MIGFESDVDVSSIFTVLIVVLTVASGYAQPTDERFSPDRLEEVSVFVHLDQVYRLEHYSSYGSGFFVHSDGYVLTSSWNIADKIDTITRLEGGRRRNQNQPILTVMIRDRSGSDRVIPAQIVAKDEGLGLALLKVEHRPSAFLDLTSLADVSVGQKVWAAGFRMTIENMPEFGVLPANVIRSSRPADKMPIKIDTNGRFDPTFVGGAMMNGNGQLVSIVSQFDTSAEYASTGVSIASVRKFVRKNAVRVRCRPNVVEPSTKQLEVSVESLLIDTSVLEGKVTFSGSDVPQVASRLQQTESGMYAVIDLPARNAGAGSPEKYSLSMVLRSVDESLSIRRRYSIRTGAINQSQRRQKNSPQAQLGSAEGGTIGSAKRKTSHESSNPNRLAGVAESIQLKSNGGVVIDETSLVEGPESSMGTSRSNELLPTDELRLLAAELDWQTSYVESLEFFALNRRRQRFREAWRLQKANQGKTVAPRIGESDNDRLKEAREKQRRLEEKLRDRDVMICKEEHIYFLRSAKEFPCRYYEPVG